MNIVWWLLIGLVAGFIARAVVPGRDAMGMLGTMILGLVGSVLGGLIGSMLMSGDQAFNPAGLIGSILGAVVVLLIWRSVGNKGGRTTHY